MSVVSISIPPVADYRNHLRMAITFVLAHLIGEPNGVKTPVDFQGIIDLETIMKLSKKLSTAKPNKSFKITLDEGLLFYTCFVLMNKVLVSKHDEVITSVLLKMLPAGHHFKDFKVFRDEMLYVNTHLIEDTEKKFKSHNELIVLKERLAEIDLG